MRRRHPKPLRSKIVAAAVVVAVGSPGLARAQSLRLRGDAFAQAPSPVGLLVLHAEDKLSPSLDAETVTWLGVADASSPGDVLTLSVRARDLRSGSEIRAGRLLVSMGAVRPTHVDGARGLLRVFGQTTLEAFAGFPVARRFDYATFDWAAGGRMGQSVGDAFAAGVSYLQRRSDGRPSDEEVGVDMAFTPRPWFTAASRAALDLVTRGPTDALASVSAQSREMRGELFTTHRSPGRMLPSTSLFSVLGDLPSTSIGSSLRWKAFPRLELLATGSGQNQGPTWGGQGFGRATLALDDDWLGSVGVEGRRVDFGDAQWTGGRLIVAVPLRRTLRVGTELELVLPDRPRGRPAAWPWALVSATYRAFRAWDIAAGVEGSSGPTDRADVRVLARASYVFDGVAR